jgi:hypothetical protein
MFCKEEKTGRGHPGGSRRLEGKNLPLKIRNVEFFYTFPFFILRVTKGRRVGK